MAACMQEAVTAGLESGVSTFVFSSPHAGATEWATLGLFRRLAADSDGRLLDMEHGTEVRSPLPQPLPHAHDVPYIRQVGKSYRVTEPSDVKALEADAEAGILSGDIILDSTDWKVCF